MRIHNKLEIVKNGESFVYYNSLLSSVLNEIKDQNAYFNYLVVGSGSEPTTQDMVGLQSPSHTFILELDSYNINRDNGVIYVKKSATVNSSESFSFSEVGVSSALDEPKSINRFLLPTPVEYSAGDSLSVSVTIYLEVLDSSNMAFVSGENILLGLLLGHNFSESEKPHTFSMCKGINRAGNELSVDYDTMTATETSLAVEPALDDSGVTINLSGKFPAGSGIVETLVGMDGKPVLRVSNYQISESETSVTETIKADSGKYLALSNPYVKSVEQILDTTSGAYVVNTEMKEYGMEYGSVNYSPFGAFDYSSDVERFLSPDGSAIAFLVDGRLDFYAVRYGAFKKLDATAFVSENLQKLKIFHDVIIARYYSESEDKHYSKYYYFADDVLVEGVISIPWENVEGELWTSFDFNICNALNSYIIGFVTANDTYMGYLVRDDEARTMTGTIYHTMGMVMDRFYVTSGSNIEDAYGVGYSKANDSSGSYIFKSSGITTRTNSAIKNLLYNFGCDVRAYNGFFYGTYNEKTLATNCRMLYFCDSFSKIGNLSHYAYTEKIKWSADGRYMIEQDADSIYLAYFTFTKTRTRFPGVFPIDEIPVSDVEDFEAVNNNLIIFRKNGKPTVSVAIVENYMDIYPVTAGNTAEVTYTTADLVGSNGSEVSVNVEIKCNI